jgi:hypothetical protein
VISCVPPVASVTLRDAERRDFLRPDGSKRAELERCVKLLFVAFAFVSFCTKAGFCICLIFPFDFQNLQNQFQNLQNLRSEAFCYCKNENNFLFLPTKQNLYLI